MDRSNATFVRATAVAELSAIASIATTIWNEHYTPIIGKDQVDYMLNKYQSLPAMLLQLQDGFMYYGVKRNTQLIGYFAVQVQEESLFISKIYVLNTERGKGIGKEMLHFIESLARNAGCTSLRLTVNKYNKATIQFYKNNGFGIARDVVFDIGNGFIMDDHEMIAELA